MSDVLLLRLEGPLQSWGDNANWSLRATRLEPTKSGVLGLLAAALGWSLAKEEPGRLGDLSASLKMGVRVDRPGDLTRDYHTIGGFRSGSASAWTGLLQADGKLKTNPGTRVPHTEVSERLYISDACFLVGLEGTPALLDALANALLQPKWPPYLGRKSCPPASPILPVFPGYGTRVSGPLLEALRACPWLGRDGDSHPDSLRTIIEIKGQGETGAMETLRQDEPVSFARRIHRRRRVAEGRVPFPGGEP